MATFDMSEVMGLADHLVATDKTVRAEGQRVIKRGAVNVKYDARKLVRSSAGTSHPKWYPSSIDFDLEDGGLAAEIGPSTGLGKQAFLGKILEYGTATNAPHPHMNPALEREEPRLADAVADAVRRALS